MNRIFDIFLSRPRLVAAIAIVTLIAGVISSLTLPMAFFPNISRPAISVSCNYPGANSLEVLNTVAGPIEDRVNGVEGFDHMTSSCADTGSYSLSVYFQAGFDKDLALMKVQAAVQEALTQLPQEVKNTGVTVGVGQTIDLGYVTCYSENGELTRDEVVDYVFGVVSPAIMRVQGVAASSVQDEKLAIRIWLDSDRMAAQKIATAEVVDAVKAQNVQASLGTVGASPVVDSNCRVISLIAKGRLKSSEEFGEIVVRANADGGVVYLRDIARIELGHEGYAHSGLFGEKPACVLHMYQLPGADTMRTVSQVKELLAELEERFPGDLKWDMTIDVARYSWSALKGAMLSIAIAMLVAFIALMLFFRSPRIALVPIAASVIVLALILIALAATGTFITVLTLYAMAAALLFAISIFTAVMIACNTGRLADAHAPLLTSGILVTAASLVLMLASGVQGMIIRQLAIVMATAGLATAFVGAAVVPALSMLVLSSWRVIPTAKPQASRAAISRFSIFAAVIAMLLATFALIEKMPRDLVPNEDLGYVLVDIKTKDGTSRPQVVEIVKEVLRKLSTVCEIEKSCTVLGEGQFTPSGENAAKIQLVLKPWSQRGRDETTLACIARMREAVSDIPEAQVSLLSPPTLPGMGSAAYVSPLLLSTADSDPVRLAGIAHRLRAILKRLPIADDATCGFHTESPHLRIHVDRAKCEVMQVPLSSLFTTLQHYLGSIYVNDVNLGTQVNRVTVMSDWKGRSAPEAMAGLYVRSATGAMIPISTLVSYEDELGPNAVYRYNRYLYCTVDVGQKAGVALGDAMNEVSKIVSRELPRDYATGWSGIAYEESSNPGGLAMATGLSLLIAYLILMVHFESRLKALYAMAPSAVAVFGGVLALYVTNVPFSLYSRFAVVALVVTTASFSLFVSETTSWWQRTLLPLLAAAMTLPLIFTSGAGMAGSRSFGMTLLGGYLLFAVIGPLIHRHLTAPSQLP